MTPLISVITTTNKTDPSIIKNIFNNYNNQNYLNKELILIINSNISQIEYINIAIDMNVKDYYIYNLNENITLGECLNYSIEKMNGVFWAKMDDDDIYMSGYLDEAIKTLLLTKADLVGKNSVILHDKNTGIIYDLNRYKNMFIDFVRGPTFFCHKSLFNICKFRHLNRSEDTKFLLDLVEKKRKIYASSEKNFIYIRNSSLGQTSTTTLKKYLGSKYKIIKFN